MNGEQQEVERLEHDVDRIRTHIGELIRELDRRRHDAFDLRFQFRHHARRMLLIGAALLGMVAGGIALAVARRRRRHSIRTRVVRLRTALRRIAAHPERLGEPQPQVGRKFLAAGGSAIAAALGKRLAKRLVSA